MKAERDDIILAVAKLIETYEISINEFYKFLGADLEDRRVDADQEIAEIAGILTGWKTSPD